MTWFVSSILGFAKHRQYVDTCDLASNYLLTCWSNDLGVSIKVVVHEVVRKLRFRPKVQFGLEIARISVPPSLLRCPPRARRNADASSMHQCAPPPLLHMCWYSISRWDSQRCSPLPHSLALTSSALPHSPRRSPRPPLCHFRSHSRWRCVAPVCCCAAAASSRGLA